MITKQGDGSVHKMKMHVYVIIRVKFKEVYLRKYT